MASTTYTDSPDEIQIQVGGNAVSNEYCLDSTNKRANGVAVLLALCSETRKQNQVWVLSKNQILLGDGSELCIGIKDWRNRLEKGTINGALLQLWKCELQNEQIRFTSANSRIFWNAFPTYCFGAKNGKVVSGAEVVIQECDYGKSSQHIELVKRKDITISPTRAPAAINPYPSLLMQIQIGNDKFTQHCVDSGDTRTNGDIVRLSPCSETRKLNQLWILSKNQILLGDGSEFCIGIKDWRNRLEKGTINGAPLQLWTCELQNENIRFTAANNTIFWNEFPTYCFGVKKGNVDSGTEVVIQECDDSKSSQHVKLVQINDVTMAPTMQTLAPTTKASTLGPTLAPSESYSEYTLTPTRKPTRKPTLITPTASTLTPSESYSEYTLTPTREPTRKPTLNPSLLMQIQVGNDANTQQCVDSTNKRSNGEILRLSPCSDAQHPNQMWTLNKNQILLGDGSDMCIGIKDWENRLEEGSLSGALLHLWICDEQNEKIRFTAASNRIMWNEFPTYCFGVEKGKVDPGAAVILQECDFGKSSQSFQLSYMPSLVPKNATNAPVTSGRTNDTPQSSNFKLSPLAISLGAVSALLASLIVLMLTKKYWKRVFEHANNYGLLLMVQMFFATFSTLLCMVDLITDSLFAMSLYREGQIRYLILVLTFIVSPIILNLLAMMWYHSRRLQKYKERAKRRGDVNVYEEWMQNNEHLSTFLNMMSALSPECYSLAASGIWRFQLPLDKEDVYYLRTLALTSNLLEDLPQIAITVSYINQQEDVEWSLISKVMLGTSIFSFFYTLTFRMQAMILCISTREHNRARNAAVHTNSTRSSNLQSDNTDSTGGDSSRNKNQATDSKSDQKSSKNRSVSRRSTDTCLQDNVILDFS